MRIRLGSNVKFASDLLDHVLLSGLIGMPSPGAASCLMGRRTITACTAAAPRLRGRSGAPPSGFMWGRSAALLNNSAPSGALHASKSLLPSLLALYCRNLAWTVMHFSAMNVADQRLWVAANHLEVWLNCLCAAKSFVRFLSFQDGVMPLRGMFME